jgi:predicted transcriptional regulator
MNEQTYQPSEAELEILQIIWALEPVSVRDIYERVALRKDVGYTTVLKQVQRLTEKGALEKDSAGSGHLYRSTVRQADVRQHLVSKVLQNAFGGSAFELVVHALGSEKMALDDLQKLKEWLDNQIDNAE